MLTMILEMVIHKQKNNVGVEEVPIGSTNVEMDGNGDNVRATNIEMDDNNNNGDSFQPDIFDPRYWGFT